MKQLLSSPRTGAVHVLDVPAPAVRANGILVQTMASLISAGTERAAIDFGQKSLVGKARSRPDLVRQVLDRARRDGFIEAARLALARLDQPAPAGYACAGIVLAAGPGATEFRPGDLVACAGAGYASHAEINYIPRNLAVHLPRRPSGQTISFEEAAFATLGAIALHGVRLARPQLGDRVAVIGLGLVGLLAGQILRAHGCRVLGIDPVPARRALAEQLGFAGTASPESALPHNLELTRGHGADIVIIAASAAGSDPVILAGELARDRATVVAIGATGLDLPRRSYYQKELSVVVSRSCGPGRYDPEFEEHGKDYPIGYVRWTERENLRAVLELIADRRVVVDALISARVPIEDAEDAYSLLDASGTLGVVLTYNREPYALKDAPRIDLAQRGGSVPGAVGVSLIGAGVFGRGVVLPALKTIPGINRRGIVTAGGVNARASGDRFGFAFCGSDADAVLADEGTRAVIITTRHDRHATLVERAVVSGKAVLVEKPLALSEAEVARLCRVVDEAAADGTPPLVMVGFNRRFAPIVRQLLDWRRRVAGPITVCYRVNAGTLPAGSWIANPSEGGGRLLGEVCHFVDLATVIAGAPVAQVFALGSAALGADEATVTLKFSDGSLASIVYVSSGDRSCSKERIEVYGGESIAVIDDFRRGWIVERGSRTRLGGWLGRQDKGHRAELAAFVEAVRHGTANPVPFEAAVATTRATLAIQESLSLGMPIDVTAC
jgi:predicted dehydrogenase